MISHNGKINYKSYQHISCAVVSLLSSDAIFDATHTRMLNIYVIFYKHLQIFFIIYTSSSLDQLALLW